MPEVFRMLVPKGALTTPRQAVRGPSDVTSAKEAVAIARGLNEALEPRHAVAMYRRALELEPGSGEAARELSLTLFDAGEQREALLSLEEFVSKNTGDHETRLAFASLLLRSADLEGAERELSRCIEAAPKWAPPFVPLVRLLWRLGRPVEARARLDAYRALSPDPRSVEMLESMMRPSR